MVDSRESVIEQAAKLSSSPGVADPHDDSDLELSMLLPCIVWYKNFENFTGSAGTVDMDEKPRVFFVN